MAKSANIVRLTYNRKYFFKLWVTILQPLYKLSKRQSELLAVFLKHRFELSKVIRDEKVLDTVLFSEESTRKIRLECGLSVPHYQVLMSQLRKLNIIDNKTIRKQLIPSIEEDSKEFRLTFHMIFDDTKR